jgi:probable rRNA maturation factor
MNVIVANRQRVRKIDSRLLKKIVATILAELEIEHCELEINLLGAREMAALNETFLGHEGSTDVITFDYGSPKKQNSRLARTLAPPDLRGEIFISVDDAIAQAKSFKTDWRSEIVHYVVHGILHLLGHDDLKSNLRRKMKSEENSLLRKISKKFSLAQIGGGSKLRA